MLQLSYRNITKAIVMVVPSNIIGVGLAYKYRRLAVLPLAEK